MTTRSAPSCAASCSTPTISPRRSSSARSPSSPLSESLINRLLTFGSVAARIVATPAAPAPMQAAAFDASMPPIAITGTRTAAQIARSPSRPDRRRGVRLRRRLPDRPDAEVVGVRGLSASSSDVTERPSRRPAARARAGSAIVLAEMHAVGAERERRVDVVVDDERDTERVEARAALDDLGGRRLHAQLHDGGAGVDRPARRLEIGDERVHPHDVRALSSSVAGSSAASAS